MNIDDIEYFKKVFGIDLNNRPKEEVQKILDNIEEELNKRLLEAERKNLELEKEIIDLMKEVES